MSHSELINATAGWQYYKKYKFLIHAILLPLLCCGCCWGAQLYRFTQPASDFPLQEAWRINLGVSTYERPIYQNGLVLMPVNGLISSYWYGIDAGTGQIVWTQSIPRNSFRRCLQEDYLVVSSNTSLYAIDPDSGQIVWQGDRAETATCSKDAVFAVVPRSFVESRDLATGQYLWRGLQPHETVRSVIYHFDEDELIAGGAIIVDPGTGQILRTFSPLFVAQPASDGGDWRRGAMYLIDQNQLFVGNVVRNASTGQIIANLGGIGRTPPEIIEETIYVSNGIQGVNALDRDTFETKWQYKPRTTFLNQPKLSTSPVAVLNGIGYVIFDDVTLRAFDPKTGQELGYWQPGWLDLVNQASCFPSRPSCMQLDKAGLVTSDDTLFVSFGDGKLYAFSTDEP